ncbi:MAG TPA: hypothetical protein K8W24_07530 [Brachybacterium paraconglomeratum]|uniref:Uncharacterized protein n=1 Tax=Brachybacterium paraconglomeratum TaxID=173362 RepID=A0A921GNZ4_9MICO|nr:hypothetical protein [Brachybacterium paraconglomeratum]
MRSVAVAAPYRPSAGISRYRLLLVLLAGIGALLVLSACGRVDSTTAIAADGSGTQTLAVTISESDMDSIDGGAATVEAAIEEHNPGLTYEGMEKDGTDTVFTMTLEFSDAKDYAAKAQKALDAGELKTTAEVTFTPPSPPFASGFTFTRNFSEKDLTRWAVKALVDDGKIADAEESDIDSALDAGESAVTVDDDGLEKGWGEDGADVWTNAAEASFESVDVITAGAEDPAAGSFTRTITYELPRETYLDAKDEFDAFFAEATPEGGELTPAGEAGTTWVLAFPAGTAEQVGTWTDAALATSESTFTVETAPNAEDPFSVDTRVVDSIECSVACGQYGTLSQSLEVPAGFQGDAAAAAAGGTEQISLEGGPEPQIVTRSYGFTAVDYELTVDRDGGGTFEMALSIPLADEEVVTQDAIGAFLGGDAERTEEEDTAVYTRTAEAESAEELSGALQKLGQEGLEGPPQVEVTESGKKTYSVTVVMGSGGEVAEKILGPGTWTIRGDGLRPTSISSDEIGSASLGEDAITVKESHGVWMTFTAERTGLGTGAIIGILVGLALLGLLVAAGVVGFLHREKIAGLLRGAETDVPDSSSGSSGPSF